MWKGGDAWNGRTPEKERKKGQKGGGGCILHFGSFLVVILY